MVLPGGVGASRGPKIQRRSGRKRLPGCGLRVLGFRNVRGSAWMAGALAW